MKYKQICERGQWDVGFSSSHSHGADVGADDRSLRLPSLPWEHTRPGIGDQAAYGRARANAVRFVRSLLERHGLHPLHLICDPKLFESDVAKRLAEKERVLARIRALIVNFRIKPSDLGWKAMNPETAGLREKGNRRRRR